ncbi:MAG: fibronectin type III domain-containing protein [Proteobacteria bacterium]|nr:fibronectin type III domain-containing protein [Pseudomonadota bacterium]
MPTISQLPPARPLLSTDEVPISQGGSACSVSIGDLLASVQPTIIVPTGSLLGRTSAGAGTPEGVLIGPGISLSGGTIIATGSDHSRFPKTPDLIVGSDLVVSDQGSQKLMPTASLRRLFTAGDNVAISADGVISAGAAGSSSGGTWSAGAIAGLQRTLSVESTDVLPISQGGTAYAITYTDLLNGLTIDQAPTATGVSDTDTLWVAQGAPSMSAQTFAAIWSWISASMPRYRMPVCEVVTDTNLTYAAHNGKLLIVTSLNVTIRLTDAQLGSGFGCEIITSAAGSVLWGAGIAATDGGTGLGGNAHARILAGATGAGLLVLASVGAAPVGAEAATGVPGGVESLAVVATTSSSLTLAWSAPTTGGAATHYVVQYRLNGGSSWMTVAPNPSLPTVILSGLAAGTSYDVQVAAANSVGMSASISQLLNVQTAIGIMVPGAPTGLSAAGVSSSAVTLTWNAPTSGGSPTGFLVQYSSNAGSTWSEGVSFGMVTNGTVTGLSASTTYSFRIAAVNASGASAYIPTSSYPTATTTSAAMAPGVPTNLSFIATYSTSVTLQWTAPNGTVTSYNVQYRVLNGATWNAVSVATNSVTITGLSPGTTYEFEVQALNGALTSAYAPSVVNTTTTSASGIYKLTPAPTRQSPTQGWVGAVVTMSNGQPASGYNVSDNSSAADGSNPTPASVGFAWSASNTVVPAVTNPGSSGLALDGHNLWYTWTVAYPSSAGNYYLWAVAKDSAGNIGGTCVSPTPFTLQ